MKIGWAFFGLVVIAAFLAACAYALDRGIYIGLEIQPFGSSDSIKYAKICRYLFPSGVHHVFARGFGIGDTPEQAEKSDGYCPLFQP